MDDDDPTPASRAVLEIHESRNISISHVTPQMAQAMKEVTELRYHKPVRTAYQYTLAGTVLVAVLVGGLMLLAKALGMGSEALAVAAVLIVGVPLGLVALKVLPKLLEKKAGGD